MPKKAAAPRTYHALMASWPTLADLASDIGAPLNTVLAWSRRGGIPRPNWNAITAAAERRGYPVTLAALEQADQLPRNGSVRVEAKHSVRRPAAARASRPG